MSEALLALMGEMLDLIDRYAQTVDRAALEHDREVWLKVKGALELAAQCGIDAALAVVARRGLRPPSTYREAFAVLAGAGIINADLGAELEAWAGLRNGLVHVYTSLDLDRVERAMKEIEPLRRFRRIAARELGAPTQHEA